MDATLTYVVLREERKFVVRCLDVELASDGSSEQEAVANLSEALELYFGEGVACKPAEKGPLVKLRGTIRCFQDPLAPVGETDWEAATEVNPDP